MVNFEQDQDQDNTYHLPRLTQLNRELAELREIIKALRKTLDDKEREQQEALQVLASNKSNIIISLKTTIIELRLSLDRQQILAEQKLIALRSALTHEIAEYQATIKALRDELEQQHGK